VDQSDELQQYAHPEALVTTEWVEQHKSDPNVRLLEVDVDTTAYDQGHIEGAVGVNWQTQLQDPTVRDLASREALEQVLGQAGVTPDTTVVVYGDNNNWFAAWAFWQLKYYGHSDVRIMNGGRAKWVEEGRELTTDPPAVEPAEYRFAGEPDESIRVYRDELLETVKSRSANLVDVRSPKEYSGELLAPEGVPQEGAQRGGHIPGAQNVPWGQAVREDGTFKAADELRKLYEGKGVTPERPAVAYCRIGERSSHTWFVLRYLLGYPDVRNYDGSWTEWGSAVRAPIEKS
jgi:thiosulfate/3-mercaptopyruvate sulfurtransferase